MSEHSRDAVHAAGKAGQRGTESPAEQTVDLLRLPAPLLARLHEMLDKADAASGVPPNRRWRRWVVRNRTVEATFRHPGGNSVRCLVALRSLSAGGVSLLHGGFVYEGARVQVHIPRLEGATDTLEGTAVRCRHIGKHVHEIGVRFDCRIEPRDYLSLGDGSESFVLEKVDPATLAGRVLVVEESRLDQKLVAMLLKDTSIEAEYADSAKNAIDIAKKGVDLIMISHLVGGSSGAELARSLRESNVMAPVILMTPDDTPAALLEAREAGVAAILAKPIDSQTLRRALAEFLVLRGGLSVGVGAIYSSLQDKEDMQDLVKSFIDELESIADKIKECVKNEDKIQAMRLCARLKGAGSSYGFEVVSRAAAEATRAAGAAPSLADASAEIGRLIDICRRCTTI